MDYSNSSKNDLIALVVARGLAKNKTAARDIKAADLRAMLVENDTHLRERAAANRAALPGGWPVGHVSEVHFDGVTATVTARAPKPPKMMPGQEPYTPAEMARVNSLVSDAARANVTESDEVLGIAYSEIETRTEAAAQTRALDVLDASDGGRLFKTADDVDAHIREERSSWDRRLTTEQRARKLARNRRRHKRSLAAWPNGQKTPRQSASEV